MFGRLMSMVPFGLAGPVGDVAEGAITAIRTIAEGAFEGLVGVTCMQPDSDLLKELNTSEPAPGHTSYRAIATDYEPEPGSGLWNSIKDHGVDMVFEGRPNDVVIPTLSGLQLGGELGEGFTDMVVFSEHDGIGHSSIFGSRLGGDVLASWVRPTPEPLPTNAQDRRHTKAEIQSIEAVGAEWGLGLLEDLTCFAPESSQSALQLAINKAGAALWPFVPGRDGPVATPVAIIVPGIMGSSLSVDGDPVWVSPWRLVGGGLRTLSVPEQRDVTADQVLCFAYRRLAEKLSDTGYQVVGQPYDWRLDLEPAANRLNDTLRACSTATLPNSSTRRFTSSPIRWAAS